MNGEHRGLHSVFPICRIFCETTTWSPGPENALQVQLGFFVFVVY